MNERYKELLKYTVFDLQVGMSPLNHEFLVEHDVTADECRDLIQLIAEAVEEYIT